MKPGMRKWLIVAGLLLVFALAVAVAIFRSQQPTAPSIKVVLAGYTNMLGGSALTNLPVGYLRRLGAKIEVVRYHVVNAGDRSVRIPQGIIIEQRPHGLEMLNASTPPQTNLLGNGVTLRPGETQTFLVRFGTQSGFYAGGGGIAWEIRAVCKTAPAEPHLRFLIWLRQQPWSRYLPRGNLEKEEVNTYTFSSAWTTP